MPAILLERLPLPSLRSYVSFSVCVLAFAAFYAHQTVKAKMGFDPTSQVEEELGLPPELANITLPYSSDEHFLNLVYVMRVETWCVWTLVNSCYCLLILLGKLIQNLVFGDLRVSEKQHLKDKFWNFVFDKFIFIFGVMNVQSMDEVVLWVAWFSALGFLHLLTQLSKDRFEYLSFSPATTRFSHIKLMSLLICIFMVCVMLLVTCVWAGINVSVTIFAFLAAESILLSLNCLSVMTRYVIQLWDMSLDGVWESRTVYTYYTELMFELVAHFVDFAHHMHMLLYGKIFLSMASLVICMRLRFLFYEFQRRIKRHKNYLRVVKDMEAKFPMATQEDLEKNADDCAICWERMESARKLPCSHLFHNSCLRSWLEQDTSCPTCRTALSERTEQDPREMGEAGAPNIAEGIVAAPNQGTINHFFHFDGSRYVSWLPSFSVEVTHTNLLPGQQAHATQTSQLDNMAREVQAVFPNIPQAVVMDDLRVTRSVDLTIDNILEGRLVIPQVPSPTSQHRTEVYSDSSRPPALPEPTAEVTPAVAAQPIMSRNILQPSGHGGQDSQDDSTQGATSQGATSSRQEENQEFTSGITAGGRFSKSASERMTMLQQRKQAMVEQAKRRYQAKHEKCLENTSSIPKVDEGSSEQQSSHATPRLSPNISSSVLDEQSRRRAVLFEATQRRLDLNNPR